MQPGRKDLFKPQIKVWVFEEEVDGRKLSEIINERHENVKYLPGVKLPENIIACPDLQVSGPCHASWPAFIGVKMSVHAVFLIKGKKRVCIKRDSAC